MGQRRYHRRNRRQLALVEDEKTNKQTKTYQNVWAASQAVLSGKFIALNNCIGKRREVLNKYIKAYLKKLEKEDQTESK